MLDNSEQNFKPKQVDTSHDWLVTQDEAGQDIKSYSESKKVKWLNPRGQGTIYIYFIDDSIPDELAQKFLKYCQAFYHGIPVKAIRAGDQIKKADSNGRKVVKAAVPDNFLEHFQVQSRQNGEWFQLHAGDIIKGLKQFKTEDTYCILAVTNNDLYPRDAWNFVFGMANMSEHCGVFSFARHCVEGQEDEDLSDEQKALIWSRRSCSTMVHEIGHMFGLEHCIYYECTMNGSNGSFELAKHPNRTLCPVCLAKLKMNAKFDCRERYIKLNEVSQELGFEADCETYAKILAEAPKTVAKVANNVGQRAANAAANVRQPAANAAANARRPAANAAPNRRQPAANARAPAANAAANARRPGVKK